MFMVYFSIAFILFDIIMALSQLCRKHQSLDEQQTIINHLK